MPAISLIVPVYNVAKWLPLCLDSIAAQTFADFELLLVDDGSTDESGAICDAWAKRDSRARVFHQKNMGLSGARNTGIDAAKGEYLAFLDSDDEVAPTWLERLYTACRDTGAQMAVCAVEDVNEDGSSQQPREVSGPVEAGVFPGKALLPHFYAPQCTYYTVAWNKLYHADLWRELRYPQGYVFEDDAVAHRLYWECETVACLPDVLNRYRLRAGSISREAVIKPSAFDSVEALLDRYRFFTENGAAPALQGKALAALWRRYLSLCAQLPEGHYMPVPLRRRLMLANEKLLPLAKPALLCGALSAREKLSVLRCRLKLR